MPPESPAQPWTSGVSIREVHHDDEQYADTSHQPPPEVASPSQRSGGDKKGEAAFLLGSQKEKEASSHERIECPICLEEFDAELDPPLALDDCGHSFHLQCLLSWSERRPTNRTCPLCGARMHSSQLGG